MPDRKLRRSVHFGIKDIVDDVRRLAVACSVIGRYCERSVAVACDILSISVRFQLKQLSCNNLSNDKTIYERCKTVNGKLHRGQ